MACTFAFPATDLVLKYKPRLKHKASSERVCGRVFWGLSVESSHLTSSSKLLLRRFSGWFRPRKSQTTSELKCTDEWRRLCDWGGSGDTMGTNELSSKTVWLSASKDALCNVWLQGGRAASRELFCKQRPFLWKQPGHANTTSNRLGGAALEQDNGGSFQCVSGTKRLHTAAFITEEDTKTQCFWASLARQEVGHAEFFKI